MKQLFEVTPFFTNIWYTQLEDYTYLIPFVHELRNKNPKVNENRWISDTYYNYEANEIMKPLLDNVRECLAPIYDKLKISSNIVLNNYWFNINNKYNYNMVHRHAGTYFSCVVYLKVPKNSGNIVFERPDMLHDYIQFSEMNNYNHMGYWLDPKPNKLVMFPSYLSHYTEQNLTNETDDERISIAMEFK